MSPERFFKLNEVQTMLGVSRTTLWRWQMERGLKVVRIGEVVRVRESELLGFLRRHETENECAELLRPGRSNNSDVMK